LRTRALPGSVTPATTDADRSTRRRSREEVPWWERAKTSPQDSPDRIKTTDRSRVANDNISTGNRVRKTDDPSVTVARQKVEQKTTKQAKQRDRRQQTPQARSADRARQKPASSFSPRSRQETPRYSSPPRESGRSRGSGSSTGASRGGGERGRREK
jgi:hypothetical protein